MGYTVAAVPPLTAPTAPEEREQTTTRVFYEPDFTIKLCCEGGIMSKKTINVLCLRTEEEKFIAMEEEKAVAAAAAVKRLNKAQ